MRRQLPLIAALVCVVLWSTTYAVSVLVLHAASPAVLSVGRFALATVVLLPFAVRRPGFWRTMRRPRTIVLGLTGIALYYAFTNVGLLFTSAGSGALSAAMTPVLTTALALVLLRERLHVRTVVGLVLATAGVVVVGGAGLSVDGGLLLCIAGLVAYSLYVVLLRRRPPEVDAIVLGTATTAWGTVLMLPWLAIEGVLGIVHWPSDTAAIVGILFEGVIVTAPTMILFNYAGERLPAALSGIVIAGIPALGYVVALGFGEPWDTVKALGGAIAVVGIAVATVAAPTAAGTIVPDLAEPEPEPEPEPSGGRGAGPAAEPVRDAA